VTETVAGLDASEKSGFGGAVTVNVIFVAAESVPLDPLIVTVAVPAVAVLDAVNVSVLEPVVEAELKEAVTPAGNPLALRATLPLNPPVGVTVIVLVPLDPMVTPMLEGLAAREKLGGGGATFGSP